MHEWIILLTVGWRVEEFPGSVGRWSVTVPPQFYDQCRTCVSPKLSSSTRHLDTFKHQVVYVYVYDPEMDDSMERKKGEKNPKTWRKNMQSRESEST